MFLSVFSVRLQTASQSAVRHSATFLFKDILQKEGMAGLFRGVIPPVYRTESKFAQLRVN